MLKSDKADWDEKDRQNRQRVKDAETELAKQRDKSKLSLDNHEHLMANRQQESDKVSEALETALKEQAVYEQQMACLQGNIENLQNQLKSKDHEIGNLKNRKDNCELVIQQRNGDLDKLTKANRDLEHKLHEQSHKQ